ncbi:U32 family peptidase [Candidatus Woesearchaeota archaeon]|nr:U32 family peptidase [Candidatus Woesearchaeota archaeon]
MKKLELLAPAGSLGTLKAAVYSGADSVYLGMNKFNAREYATNFNEAYLKEAIKLCKSNNVKIYLTMNTLIKNCEIKAFLEQLKYAYEQGIDSVIIQDPCFIEIIRESFPGLRIHMSTQAGIMNSFHANLFSGADRINVARELDKTNIGLIRKKFNKEIEIFVHGALCACISGSCLFSSLLGGRSGNRGKCAQPCRKLYNNSYLLSTKDLCLIEKIPEIINLGINSVKIEGRMRTPYYVATTTSIYRKAVDSFYKGKFEVTTEMKNKLRTSFLRDFTQGEFSNEYVFNPNQVLKGSKIKEEMYEVKTNPINIEKRRANIKELKIKNKNSSGKQLIVRVYNERDALIAEKYADIIVLDLFHENFKEIEKKLKKPIYAITPRIMFDSDIEKITNKIKELSPNGLIAGNLGIMNMGFNLPIILDYNSNCFNDLQLDYYQKLGAKPIMSQELSLNEIENFKNKDFIVFVHGKIRVMTLAHDLPELKLKDEHGFNFYIKKIFNGVEILNEKELGLFNQIKYMVKDGVNQLYVDTETNIDEILHIYRDILYDKVPKVSKLKKKYVLGWSRQGVL